MGAGLSVRPLSVVEVAPRGILEASSEAPRLPVRANTRDRVRKYIGQYGLIAVLLIMPVAFGLHDLATDGNLTRLGNNLVAGVSNGAILALIALGYTLVYGIIELINFAHGEVFMIGSLIAVAFWTSIGLTEDTALPGLIFGLLATLIVGLSISRGDLLALVATIPLVLLLTTFIARSRLGKAMRATAQDPEASRLMGINVDTTISLTFLLGGLLAGAAGLISTLYQTSVWYFQGFTAGLIAFTAAVMGGIGNLKGAVLGGLIIGCIQQLADNRIGAQWTTAVVFAYLVLIMVFRPQGLIGEVTREAG